MTELLCGLAWEGKAEEVKELLPQLSTFGVNGLSKRGQTALYCAARQGHSEVVSFLLGFEGIDPDKPCPDHGGTPLHAAGFQGHEIATAMLLYYGANPQALNKAGVAARSESRGRALNAYTTFESGSHEALLKQYPVLAKISRPVHHEKKEPLKSKQKKEKDREKEPHKEKERKKKEEIKAIPSSSNMIFIQRKDMEVESLHKVLCNHNKSVVCFISSYTNPTTRKFLDHLVLVNSLLQKNGYSTILIGSGTWETSIPFWKDYIIFKETYQDPSLASFDVMGFKRSTLTAGGHLGGVLVINWNQAVKSFQIIAEAKETASDQPSLNEILSVCGASADQMSAFSFLDAKIAEKKVNHLKKDSSDSSLPPLPLPTTTISIAANTEEEIIDHATRKTVRKSLSMKLTGDNVSRNPKEGSKMRNVIQRKKSVGPGTISPLELDRSDSTGSHESPLPSPNVKRTPVVTIGSSSNQSSPAVSFSKQLPQPLQQQKLPSQNKPLSSVVNEPKVLPSKSAPVPNQPFLQQQVNDVEVDLLSSLDSISQMLDAFDDEEQLSKIVSNFNL